MNKNLEALIRERAYNIWEHENRPDGKHEDHWSRAKAEIEAEREQMRSRTDAVSAPKRSRSKTVARSKRRAG